MSLVNRRRFLAAGLPLGLAAATLPLSARAKPPHLPMGLPLPFSFEWLRVHAQHLARYSYRAPKPPAPALIGQINFDIYQKIKFRPECALWAKGPEPFPLRFFHLGKYANLPVRIHALRGRWAHEIFYGRDCFDYGGTGFDKKLPDDIGYSGFRVMNGQNDETDWLAFQGASYFRASGADNQYGASARGIAINTALSTREEFPAFTQFWIAESTKPQNTVAIYALLEGPSVTGAYKFDVIKPGGEVMDVHADLFFRADITRLGVAPLTSMYWYGENERRRAVDWRPEIHDSDGLAMWTGRGERIWRPLIDPPSVQTNSFLDSNPKGFGLLQRDRNFDDYQDDGAFYNKRPSIWVEPRGNWGDGAVQLVEIPTDDEYHDNIVAYWQPHTAAAKGGKLSLDYRLYWQDDEPHPATEVARVVATRIGRHDFPKPGGPAIQRKFVIDFQGGPLAQMAQRYDITPVVTLSRGTVDKGNVLKVVGTDRWRALFDVSADGNGPLDMRCFLRLGGKTLSETWLYQYFAN